MEMTGPPVPSDDDLLRRLRAGDEGAFGTLYQRWQGPVYRLALRLSGLPEVAEDVTQEVFLALIHGPAGYDSSRGLLGPYLLGIARNQARRRLERDRPYLALDEDAEGDDGRRLAPDGDDAAGPPSPLEELTRQQDVSRVREAVLSLPLHYREAVVLCDLHLLSYEDAARALDCALGTVRSRLARGRELLAAKLRPRPARAQAAGRSPGGTS
jgi:RNA polymerase sigma-70 factor (ECF subfamily)